DFGHHLLLPARKKVPVLRVLGSPFLLCRDSYHLASHSIEVGGDRVPRHTHLIDDFAQLDRNRHDTHLPRHSPDLVRILPWHRRSSYEPDAPARGVPQSPRWRVGLVCARMRNFLAGVITTRRNESKSLATK